MQEETCSRLSLEAGEPLAGSAAETEFWVVLEHQPAWGPKGLEDSGLPQAVVAHLGGFAKSQPRARVQLIRRPERGEAAPGASGLALYLARGTQGALALWRTQLQRVEDSLELDLASWAQGAEPAGFSRMSEPLYLVCVHGRRDRCCAQKGMPVYSAFAAQVGDAVWQTSHLGGHRFAATLVVLPAGISYGRLEAGEASALIEAHARGRLHALDKLRGRCAYPAEAQAADVSLREQLREHALDAVRWLGSEQREDGVYVTLRHEPSAAEHTLRVTHRSTPPFPQSCGASHRPGDALIALGAR
ncbi:MAG TPA: sucrase ferredoxin [Polyangiales bacterium]